MSDISNNNNTILKRTVAIMVPVILQNLLTYFANMIDSVMLSSYGQSEFAASSLANQAWFIYVLFAFGLSTGSCILTSQYFASKDKESISAVVTLGFFLSVTISFIFFVILFFLPENFLKIYTDDPKLIKLGASYLKIVAPGYLLAGVSTLYSSYLKSIEKAVFPLVFNGITICVNTVFNYFLIFGTFSFPKLGIQGAAIATLISKIVEFTVIVIYFSKREEYITLKVNFKRIKELIKDFTKYSLPVLFNETVWGIGISFQTAIYGRMGEKVINAANVTGMVEKIGLVVCMGLYQAASVILGIELGRDKFKNAKKYATGYMIFSAIFGVIFGIIIYSAYPIIINAFSLPLETAFVYKRMSLVLCILLIVKSINCMGICAVLRSGGDTRAALLIDIPVMILITNPLGAIIAMKLKADPWVVYSIFISEEFIKMPIMLLRIKTGKWLKNITK